MKKFKRRYSKILRIIVQIDNISSISTDCTLYVESYEPYLFYECGLHDRVYIIGCVEDQSRFFRGTGRLETDGRDQGE